MHTTYSSTSIISLRTTTTPSYVNFNDCFNNYSNERCPLICCSFCCSFPVHSCKLIAPTNPNPNPNPSYLFGLRQSTLIQFPPSRRRLILGCSDRYVCRTSIYDVGRCGCFEACCGKERRVDRNVRKRNCKDNYVSKIKGRIARPRVSLRSNALGGDVDAMLSLLCEESVEECVIVREKKRGSFREGKVSSEKNGGVEKLRRDRKPNVGFGFEESEAKSHELELGRVRYRDEGCKRKEERESVEKDEDQSLRKRGPSSSYYSVSDSWEFGSDVEVEISEDQFVGESSSSHERDSRESGGVVINEERKQSWERGKDEKDQELRSSARNDFRVGGSIQQDWRKKSEKKLTEESEEIKSSNDSAVRQSQSSQAKGSNSMMASSLKKEFKEQEKQATSDVMSLGQSSSHIQKENRASMYSKSSRQHEHLTQSSRKNIETTSATWGRFSQGKDVKVVSESQETGCDYCKTCGRSMEESKAQSDFQCRAEQSGMSIGAKLTTAAESLSENRHSKHQKNSSSLQSSIEGESKQHDQVHMGTGQVALNRKSQHHHETITTDDSCFESTLKATQAQQAEAEIRYSEENSRAAVSQSETRLRKEEKCSTSLQTSAKEESKQLDEIYLATGQFDARRKSQRYIETLDTNASYLESILRSQQQLESRMKHLEEKTSSLTAAEEVKNSLEKSGGKVTKDIASSKVLNIEIGDSRVHSSNLEMNSQSVSDKRVYNEQSYSKSKVKSIEELVEKRKWIDETIVRSSLGIEVQGPSTGQYSRESIISQPSVPLISQSGVQQFRGEKVESGQASMTIPPYQYVNRRSHQASSSPVRNDMGRTMEVGSDGIQEHPQARTPSSYGQVVDSGSKSGEFYSSDDALVSAARMQESSALIVGEFLEKMSHEAPTSETRTGKESSKLDIKHEEEKFVLRGSTQSDIDKTGLQKQGSDSSSGVFSSDSVKKRLHQLESKHSSMDSGTKGPSDQMWDVKDHFVQEGSEMESPEGATPENVGAVRTGKFLWNTVAAIVRLRWGSHSEKQKSPVKAQSSPSGSASGETWFSGTEADEPNGDDMKTGQTSLLQEPTSDQPLLRTSKSQEEDVGVIMDNKMSHVDVGASSSSSVVQSGTLTADTFVGESTNLNVANAMPLPSPLKELSIPSARQLRRSSAFEETDGADKNESPSPISSSEEQRDVSIDGSQTDVSPSEGTDVELKKKKLQRSKVVLQRFDEWEDAYKREREQRKVDEIFMREALSEAIKAADSWEVPVGAVLVQNGKIIARGFNLVEELRDSTAHAEMICIREASNVLRTWRLSETTLYVTLEPCPMCAGAILQARISNLVWGSPNKLLGADGSWIRLFPEGMEGEERAEVTDKPAAPSHPFHPKMNIRRGILQEECADIMQQFFQLRRRKAKESSSSSDEAGQPSCFPKKQPHRKKLLHKMHNVFHPSKQSSD